MKVDRFFCRNWADKRHFLKILSIFEKIVIVDCLQQGSDQSI